MKPPVSLIDFNTTVPKTRPQRMFAIMTHNDIMTPRHFLLYLFPDDTMLQGMNKWKKSLSVIRIDLTEMILCVK